MGGSARVELRNATGSLFKFQVVHQYTGWSIEESDYILVKPGETAYMLDVHYNYGFLTTGRDN